jgi:hypothetical protein
MGHKVVAINGFWLTVISTLIASGILGGIGYAWNANAAFSILQNDVDTLKKANITERLASIEQQVISVQERLQDVKNQQNKMDEKLDKILVRNQ